MSTNLIGGIILIIAGILTKIFPILIAGYNTMTKEQKAKVDIKGLSTFMSICLCAMGILLIVLYLLGYRDPATIVLITLPSVIFMVIFAQRYDHNKSGRSRGGDKTQA